MISNRLFAVRLLIPSLVILLFGSCQRTGFSTSGRISHHGRVTYSNRNHYAFRIFTKRIKTKKQNEQPLSPGSGTAILQEIKKLPPVPVQNEEMLIASTERNPEKVIVTFRKPLPEPAVSPKKKESGKTAEPKDDVPASAPETKLKVEPYALTGFILSILGLFPVLGLPLAIPALACGIKGLRTIRHNPTQYRGRRFAVAAICLGAVGIALSLLWLGLIVAFFIGMMAMA